MTANVPRRPSASLRALVAGLVDYAGLFPPASLSMADAVAHYATDRASPEGWMLGRFIVPAARLDELAEHAGEARVFSTGPWRLAALVGDDAAADAARIAAFNEAQAGALVVDVVEAKASTSERIAELGDALGTALTLYCEIPVSDDPRALLEIVRTAGARAKIRTGGVTAAAFPDAPQVARFLARCATLALPFKATAGLHHPLRGEHRLTYADDAPRATMFGFLNVFVAAALASSGADEPELVAVLEEREPSAFTFGADGLRWRSRRVELDHLAVARTAFAIAFGSCSFREPVDDLRELALL